MLVANLDELAVVRSSFCRLVARWRLTQGELRELLGGRQAVPVGRVLPDFVDADAETRMRLLLRLDRALATMFEDADVGQLLRQPDPGKGPMPLRDLTDLDVLRATVWMTEGSGRGDPVPAPPGFRS